MTNSYKNYASSPQDFREPHLKRERNSKNRARLGATIVMP
jgi:hypothetical protein